MATQARYRKQEEVAAEAPDLSPLRKRLVEMSLDPDTAFATPASELDPMRLAAAQELFAERRSQISLLARRADDAGIDVIRSFDDIVPLLFAHTVYKSYPPQFFAKGRWDAMLKWLQTLSVSDLSNVDVRDVKDVDDWLARLWDAGHAVLCTSGSSGKVSFLTHTMADRARKTRHLKHTQAWPFTETAPGRPVFWFGPMVGRNSAVEMGITNEENWGSPGETNALDAQPLLIADVSRTAAMRTRIAAGTATPDEIAEFEQVQADKSAAGAEEIRALIDKLLDMRHQPLYIYGLWAQHLMVRDRARERGIPDGDFHPDTVLFPAGGIKGLNIPADYREQVTAFYGDVIQIGTYGMTEMAQLMPRCEARCYHVPPGLILLLLDQDGERLLRPDEAEDGKLTGRVGFLDLLYEGRWGGLITGDKATMDLAPQCACGRAGPVILDTVARFAQVGQDDHIGCAGTIDAYVRGGLPS
ncbi:hypothetical protein ABC347_06135 [Sphingomonas sp. 1P06PA]|uniref:hypothetical protein n=1 Tax=Sphingomonas sp. 1P06PA TaxID=554121 RepID=UPI0039A71AEF